MFSPSTEALTTGMTLSASIAALMTKGRKVSFTPFCASNCFFTRSRNRAMFVKSTSKKEVTCAETLRLLSMFSAILRRILLIGSMVTRSPGAPAGAGGAGAGAGGTNGAGGGGAGGGWGRRRSDRRGSRRGGRALAPFDEIENVVFGDASAQAGARNLVEIDAVFARNVANQRRGPRSPRRLRSRGGRRLRHRSRLWR